MPFSNPIIGGAGTLIRQAIQSPDFVTGVSGWAIRRDGTVEFSDGEFRGDISGATGTFSGTVSASNVTAGTLSATMGITGKIRTAASGARVELDGAGVRAYDSGGTNTVNIASTGSATIEGDFATGRSGGSSAYVTMNDASDRSTISFWNAAGSNDAYINSPQTSGVPTVGINSGTFNISGTTPGRTRCWVNRGLVSIGHIRDSDGSIYGGGITLLGTSGRLGYFPLGGAQTGGQVYVDSSQAILSHDTAGSSNGAVTAKADGVHSSGTFVSDAGWSASPGTNFTLQEFALDRWGMWVFVHVWVRRTTSNLVPPADFDIGATTLCSITSAGNLPTVGSTRFSMGGNANVMGGCSLTSTGKVVLHTLTKTLAIGDDFHVQFNYSQ